MQVTKKQLEDKEVQIAELKTLCEQQKVCFSNITSTHYSDIAYKQM